MTLANFGFLVLGAVLVACGMLVASLADRVRGLRITRSAQHRTTPEPRRSIVVMPKTVDSSNTIFVPDEDPAATQRHDRMPRATPRKGVPIVPDAGMAADVVAALMATGYNKRTATNAVQACSDVERGSLADWTRAALRRTREEVLS